jgi:RNA polymerase-binding transcription factor DksA
VKAAPKKVATKAVKASPKVVKAAPKKVATKAVKASPKVVKAGPKKVAAKIANVSKIKDQGKVNLNKAKTPSEILLSKPIDTNLVIITKVKPAVQNKVPNKSIFDGPGSILSQSYKNTNLEAKKKKGKASTIKSKPLSSKEIKDFKKVIEKKLKISENNLISIIERRKKLESDLLDPDHKKLNQENGITNDSYFYDINIELTNANHIIFDCEEALDAIRNKTYGICIKCKSNISRKRLEVRVTSLYCVECKPVKQIENNLDSLEDVLTEGFSDNQDIEDSDDEDDIEIVTEK